MRKVNGFYLTCDQFNSSYGTNVYSSGMKAEQLQPGDVICIDGHVDIVVKKDSNNVYIGAAGSSNAISATASNGYRLTVSVNEDINNYYKRIYSKSIKSIRR